MALGAEGEYTLYPLQPENFQAGLESLLSRLRRNEIQGLNVTIPYKQAVIPFLDLLTPLAQRVGAVNTLFMEGKKLVGDNTDVPGFLKDLENCALPNAGEERCALVLGAGGSASAAAYALLNDGWQVTIAARRLEQAETLIQELKGDDLPAQAIPLSAEALAASCAQTRPVLIVNATPVGMYPNVQGNPWPEGAALPGGAFVYDLIYRPRQTAFIRMAQQAGCQAVDGAGMLVEQAALSFERWTARTAPRQAMRQALEAALV
jgi:shikimate dehydrogenase